MCKAIISAETRYVPHARFPREKIPPILGVPFRLYHFSKVSLSPDYSWLELSRYHLFFLSRTLRFLLYECIITFICYNRDKAHRIFTICARRWFIFNLTWYLCIWKAKGRKFATLLFWWKMRRDTLDKPWIRDFNIETLCEQARINCLDWHLNVK